MSSWNRSYFSDGYGGDRNEATDGKKRPPSRPKKSGSKKADDDDPSYTANTNHNGDNHNDNYNGGYNGAHNNGGYNGAHNNGVYNGYGITPYNNGGSSTTPYYYGSGGSDYSNNNSSYSTGGGTGGAAISYNAPASFWAPQDGTKSPMIINTREVHVYGAPGSQYDGDYNNDQRRRGGGFFRPAFESIGHFFDRKLGFNDRD